MMKAALAGVLLAAGLFAFFPAIAQTDDGQTDTMDINGKTYNVIFAEDANARIPSFNKGAHDLGIDGKITACEILLDIPAGGNHSYGGLCTLKLDDGDTTVQICNDDKKGFFAVAHLRNTAADEESLADFVASNCFGRQAVQEDWWLFTRGTAICPMRFFLVSI
ncbi:MAG: hypothetical protein AB7H77_11365 [Bdellovibrionales bacterium]